MQDVGVPTPSVKELHERMTFHVLRAGIGPAAWAKIIHNIERKSDARQEYIRSFLIYLLLNEWKAVNDVWKLPNATEEMWNNMENLYEGETFPELIKLKKAQRKLKDKWLEFKIKYKDYVTKERSNGTNKT